MSRSWRLSRRTLLGGAGAAIALPWLEAMVPSVARAASAATPTRFLAFYVPNGIFMPAFTPKAEGAGYALSESLKPIAPLKQKMLVLTGLDNKPGNSIGPGAHASGTGAFLTAVQVIPKSKTHGSGERSIYGAMRNSISIDQAIAQKIGNQTSLPSMQLAIDGARKTSDSCDNGYYCAYQDSLSWAGPTSPLTPVNDPRAVFDRLFKGFDSKASDAEARKRLVYRRSVIDYAKEQVGSLDKRLGASDRQRLDRYMTGLRQLESRIDKLEQGLPRCDNIGGRPAGRETLDLKGRIDAMYELMVKAFECDLTRTVSFMLARSGSGRRYDFLGAKGTHHNDYSHHNSPEWEKWLRVIDRWEVEQFTKLAQRLDSVEDGPGKTLLDNSLLFFSSEISDGNRHNHTDLPVLVAGRGGGYVKSGRHLRYPKGTKLSDLFLHFSKACGAPLSSFGDSSGLLPHIT